MAKTTLVRLSDAVVVVPLGATGGGGGAAVPEPVSVMACGVPAELSVMVTAPLRGPSAVGVKVMPMAQLAPAASDAAQVVVRAKSPVAAIPVIVSAALPVLESVTVRGVPVRLICWLPNATLAAVRLATAAGGAVPVPVSVTPCGLPASLPVMVIAPARAPAAAGVNVMLMAQVAPGASGAAQVLVCAKSPVSAMPLMFNGALPVF